ncbi:hypothetical protein [Trueperella pecoris]|uniref:Restriction endonuclease n=1 Tax=Trueperella pecoris TaxID=2733571 RepID=A0A7M1QUD0_9ACTO|nr:hypothetical protein [Trueperella pecoris]QOR44975.1 hypothetical protein INS88_06695 [Trueperella pecoris]
METLEKLLSEELARTQSVASLDPQLLDRLFSVYPFNKFEYIISHLIALGNFNLDDYLDLRNSYLERNKFLYLFEITAPRTFGETWAQRHLNELIPELERPNKSLDPSYSGEYDFWVDGIKIEVKASRAVQRKSGEPLTVKALSSNSSLGFDMNFQQIKPKCCDVFVWIGVWRDRIRYWVLSSSEVEGNQYFSVGQHRGNVGEGQLWVKESNISQFTQYECDPRKLLEAIRRKASM